MRNHARVAGILFLVAMVTSLTGGGLIEGLPDVEGAVLVGVALELTNAIAVIGIIAALWVPLSRAHSSLAVGYVGVRVLEAGACAAAALIPLAALHVRSDVLDALRDTIVSVGVPVFFGVGAVLLYIQLLRSHLVPRFLAIWGFVGAAGILANVVIGDPVLQPILVLPIIANEITLGIVLIVRGFRPAVVR